MNFGKKTNISQLSLLFFLLITVVCKDDSDCLNGDICYIPKNKNPTKEGFCQGKYFALMYSAFIDVENDLNNNHLKN